MPRRTNCSGSRQAKQLLQRAARDVRWLPVQELQSLSGRALYPYLAIPAARFYLRELHDVVGSKCGGRDNHAVCNVLAGLTSRSPEMMAELRKLWYLLDSNGTALNAMLPRYNAAWLDPGCEAVDSLHRSDVEWRRENNYCNPPWPLLPDLVQKLRHIERRGRYRRGPSLEGQAATVARYIAWQGLRGLSRQPVCSLTFPRSTVSTATTHGAEPVAQGDLMSKVNDFSADAVISQLLLLDSLDSKKVRA
eukprot:jgi/Tetstr1/431222/TSEL_020934.t1